jgi:alpha-1,2-mannosyltransferase
VALIFIPYLLLTGRYRQAGAAAAAFAATVAAGALLFPRASVTWWLGGAFLDARRTGFAGYLANQSLLGMTTRLAGAVPSAAAWLVLAVLAGGPALALAALVHRQGRPVHGWVICAVTGLIISPVSWDHHWVWIAPALAVLTDTAVRAQPALSAAWRAFAGLVAIIFRAWPSLWPGGGAAVPWGLIWYAPATPADTGTVHPEYHWAGLQLLAGNLYLLAGFAILAAAVTAARHPAPPARTAPIKTPLSAGPLTGRHRRPGSALVRGSAASPANPGSSQQSPVRTVSRPVIAERDGRSEAASTCRRTGTPL